MKNIIIVSFIVLSLVFCFSTSNADERETGGVSKINASFRSGEISREEYIVSKLRHYFSREKVSGRSKSAFELKPTREITLLLREASRSFDTYSDENQAYVAMFLKRPDNITSTNPLDGGFFYLPEPILVFDPSDDAARYPTISGKMKFWYVEHSDPDGGGNVHTTTTGFVRLVADAFETVHTKTIEEMDYPAPPDDLSVTENGGDAKIDIYIMNTGAHGIYGYAVPEESEISSASFMVMDNDFTEFITVNITADQAMQVTAAHEFHHVVQFGINSYASGWIMEATSTWIEDQIYDEIDDNLQYLNGSGGFFEIPHYSLDSSDQFYNAWIWLEYMKIKWGQASVKSIWVDFLVSGNNNGTLAVENTINSLSSSMMSSFTEFSKVNYTQTDFYPSEALYNDVAMANESGLSLDYSTDTSHLINSFSTKVNHLAAKYYKFIPGDSITAADVDSLTLNINGENGQKISAAVVVKKSDGSYTERAVIMNTSNDGSVEIDNFSTDNVSEVVLILVNYSTDENFNEFVVSGGLGQPAILSSYDDSSTCFIDSVY